MRDDARHFPLPPWLWSGTAREPLREALGRAKWLLISYWVLLVSGYVALTATVLGLSIGGGHALIAALAVVSVVGVLAGNLLGLLRLRAWIVNILSLVASVIACYAAVLIGPTATAIFVTFFWSVGCGHLTLQRRFSLATLWIPIVCWTGAIVTIINHSNRIETWEHGHKSAVWQPLSAALLFLAVVQVFLFFAGQEHYHLKVWQAHGANAQATVTKHAGGAHLTTRGLVALVALAVVVCGAVAMISPYLWRTRVDDGDGRRDRHSQHQPPRNDPEPSERSRDGRSGFDWQRVGEQLERAAREAARQSKELLPFVPLFLLNRPLRRLVLLRHLRAPMVPVSPTQRMLNLWRYVLIALGDAKLLPDRGESLEALTERIRARKGAAPRGLAEAAGIHQRVRFGLGIPEGSLDAMKASATTAASDIRATLTLWQRVSSWWRKLDS